MKIHMPVLVMGGILLSILNIHGQSGLIEIPRSGQTVSYHPGDDGDLQMGKVWPNPRFTDHGNGSCTDHLTGLMWTTDGNLMASRDPSFDQDRIPGDGDVDWTTALAYIEKLNVDTYLGFNDWRLPNVNELLSICDLSRDDTALSSGHPVAGLKKLYWSSTTRDRARYTALGVFLREYYVHANITQLAGEVDYFIKYPELYSGSSWEFYVIPVRGDASSGSGSVKLAATGQSYAFLNGDDGSLREGLAWPDPRYTSNGDSTVTDRLTGLCWRPVPI